LEAAAHKGTSIVEVLQNCVIFNDNTWGDITDRENRDDRILLLKHGEPMIYGKNRDKGLILKNNQLHVVTVGQDGYTEKDILIHDAHTEFRGVQLMLANMEYPQFPMAIGVIRSFAANSSYDSRVEEQIDSVKARSEIRSVKDLLFSGATWEVK